MDLHEFRKRFDSEEACELYLENLRWKGSRNCPYCGNEKTYRFTDGKLFKCGACKKQFNIRIGTIFSESKVPLFKWFLTIFLATSLKKGVSSAQLARYIGVTQKTAWLMLQRIRLVNGNMRIENQQKQTVLSHPSAV